MAATKRAVRASSPEAIGKRIRLDRAAWDALELLARDRDHTIDELAESAFNDLLRKHGRSADLGEALQLSVRTGGPDAAAVDKKAKPRGRAQRRTTTRR